MKKEVTTALKGALLATAVAGLFATGCQTTQSAVKGAGGDVVMCHGANSCKGAGACKGASHGCSGKNTCKGKGWIKASRSDCEAKGGKPMAMKSKM